MHAGSHSTMIRPLSHEKHMLAKSIAAKETPKLFHEKAFQHLGKRTQSFIGSSAS